MYNLWVLFAFIWRLFRIRKSMLESFDEEKNKYRKILKLNRLMIKMCFLVSVSILVTWVFLFVGVVEYNISLATSYSIMVDSLCMWLLFSSITEAYWDCLVSVFYLPCLCF